MSTDAIIQKINLANPDFLVVALGAGKGQAWIQKNKQRLNAPVISHLGAVINFVAGHVERAPVFWQRMGLEWVWRIKQEPLLWRRYFFDGLAFIKLILTKVIPLVIYDGYLRHSADFNEPMKVAIDDSTAQIISLSGSVKSIELDEIKSVFNKVLNSGDKDVILDFTKVTYIDAGFIGLLLLLQNSLHEQGEELVLKGDSMRCKCLLKLNLVWNRIA